MAGRRRTPGATFAHTFGLILVLALASLPNAARAQIGSDRYSSIVIEAASGRILSGVNVDEPRYPASLTKMMTLYMVFEALRDRRIALAQYVPVSYHAASMSPSKLGLLPSTRITVEEAILGLVTKSANDAAAALGEMLGGDEDRFAQMMTLRARALGMSRTVFRNASGLPDPEQVSTARDLALLARHLVQDFPSDYRYFSTASFVFHRRTIYNHDAMLQRYPGADGLKTGYTEAAGHNLVTSAVRGDVRLVGVVLGAASNPERDIHMASLLDQGFEQMDVPVAPRREPPFSNRLASALPGSVLPGGAMSAPLALSPAVPAPRLGTLRAALPEPPRPRLSAVVPKWSVIVGTYTSETAARQAAALAERAYDVGDTRIAAAGSRGRPAWRVEIIGLSPPEARAACPALARRHLACMPVRAEGGQFASR